jgi:hypothetical protein
MPKMKLLQRLLQRKTKFITHILPRGETILSWRSDDAKVDAARTLWKNELFRQVYATVTANRPRGYPQRGAAIDQTQALIEFGRMQGYEDCLRVFEVLTEPVQRPENIEVTWGVDEEETQNR